MRVTRRLPYLTVALWLAFYTAAFAEAPSPELAARIEAHLNAVEAQLQQLRQSSDGKDQIALARLFATGVPKGPQNPLLVPDPAAAIRVLAPLEAGSNQEFRQQAALLHAQILMASSVDSDVALGKSMELQLAAAGSASALARILSREGRLPDEIDPAIAQDALEKAVLAGNYSAAFALAKLVADSDGDRSRALVGQGILQLSQSAAANPGAAVELARRYITGDGLPVDYGRAGELLDFAADFGLDSAISMLDQASPANAPGIERTVASRILKDGLVAGSAKAAQLLASSVGPRARFDVLNSDGFFALSLLADSGDVASQLLAIEVFSGKRGLAPDLPRADFYLGKVLDGAEGGAKERLELADTIEKLKLPTQLTLARLFPFYRSLSGAATVEGEYRADRLLAEATKTGAVPGEELSADAISSRLGALAAAGASGHASSLMLLGDLYLGGTWVAADARRALELYEQADALEQSFESKERVAKALRQSKATEFEEARYGQLLAELSAEGSKWARLEAAIAAAEDPSKATDAENLISSLADEGYLPATRALVRQLSPEDPRFAKLLSSLESNWAGEATAENGRLLADAYKRSGARDKAIALLKSEQLRADPLAHIALARLMASDPDTDAGALEAAVERGIAASAGLPDLQFEFVDILKKSSDSAARQAGRSLSFTLAKSGNVAAISALLATAAVTGEMDAELRSELGGWVESLAKAQIEAPIVDLALRFLTPGAEPDLAATVFSACSRALERLPAASDLALPVAQALYLGYGTTVSVAKGNALVEAGAAAGNGDALAELGLQYFYGMGRTRDTGTAVALLKSGVALGSNVARVELGRLLSASSGPSVNPTEAASLFEAAANSGSLPAMVELGRLHIAGWGVAKDEAAGVTWLTTAADRGSSDAMMQLYFHYLLKDTPTDRATAQNWLRRSVNAGVNSARVRLAASMLDGAEQTSPDYADAMQLLDDAFAAGYNLANKYKKSVLSRSIPTKAAQESSK